MSKDASTSCHSSGIGRAVRGTTLRFKSFVHPILEIQRFMSIYCSWRYYLVTFLHAKLLQLTAMPLLGITGSNTHIQPSGMKELNESSHIKPPFAVSSIFRSSYASLVINQNTWHSRMGRKRAAETNTSCMFFFTSDLPMHWSSSAHSGYGACPALRACGGRTDISRVRWVPIDKQWHRFKRKGGKATETAFKFSSYAFPNVFDCLW